MIIPAWYPRVGDPYAGNFIRLQAQALRATGLNISVLSFDEDRLPFMRSAPDFSLSNDKEVPTYRLRAFTPPKRIRPLRSIWFAHWDRLLQYFVRINGQLPDLLHAHSFVGGAAARYLSERYQIPYLLTEHYSGFISDKLPTHWRGDLASIYRDAEKVIAVSPALANAMQSFVSGVEVIPNMVDTEIFNPTAVAEGPKQIKTIISVGSLIPRKNYTGLLQSFARLAHQLPLKLVIVGNGPRLRSLNRLSEQLGIAERVRFTGALSPPELAAAFRSADLYVSTSLAESFGLAPVEALASGVPVVMLRCNNILEARPFVGVSIVDKEADLVPLLLEQLMKDRPDPQQLSDQVVAGFSPDKTAKAIEKVYEDILLGK